MQARIRLTRIMLHTCVAAVIVAIPGLATAQIQVILNEKVSYSALSSSGSNQDRPSIAVRGDGEVRIAISDFQGPCCPLQVPLKVATRGASGGWTHLTVCNYGDHSVPHFLNNGNLGVTYNDFGSGMTIQFAEVTSSAATIGSAYTLGKNPSGFTRLTPWTLEPTGGNIQAVVQFDLRLRRTATGWSSATLAGSPQDIALGTSGEVHVLTSQGLVTFSGYDLNLKGTLNAVSVPSGGNLVIDGTGNAHIALRSSGTVSYGFSSGGAFSLETVAMNTGELLNDQALLLDGSGSPYIVYQNSAGNMVVAGRSAGGWSEQAVLGPGVHGTMVLGPLGRIHASYTDTTDRLVHYALLQTCKGSLKTYGSGLAGSGAFTPTLSGTGCPELGQTIYFDVASGLGGAGGALFIGVTQVSVPGLGGTLLVDPLIQLFHTLGGAPGTPGAGAVTFTAPVPNLPALLGLTVYLQAMYQDSAAPVGVSMTNGLAVAIG